MARLAAAGFEAHALPPLPPEWALRLWAQGAGADVRAATHGELIESLGHIADEMEREEEQEERVRARERERERNRGAR